MEYTKRWVTSSYIVFSLILGICCNRLLHQIVLKLGYYSRYNFTIYIVWGVPIIIVIGTLLYLIKHAKANEFMTEVVIELSKVTWPTKKETWASSLGVLIFVIIAAILLSVFDYIWIKAIELII